MSKKLVNVLCRFDFARAGGEARRLIKMGVIKVDGIVIKDINHTLTGAHRIELKNQAKRYFCFSFILR